MRIDSLFVVFLGGCLAVKAPMGVTIYELMLIPLMPYIAIKFFGRELGYRVVFFLTISFALFAISLFTSCVLADDGLEIAVKDVLRWGMVFPVAVSLAYLGKKYEMKFLAYLVIGYQLAALLMSLVSGDISIENRYLWRNELGEELSLLIIAIGAISGRRIFIAALMLVIVINMYMDFRSMALVAFLVVLLEMFRRYSGRSARLGFYLVGLFMAYGFFVAYQNINIDEVEKRRMLSNLVRLEITLTAIDDLISPNILGNGYLHFFKTFQVKDDEDSYFEATESEMPIHGYLWVASYEAGKLGFLFMLLLFLYVTKVIKYSGVGQGANGAMRLFLCMYFLYGCFMFAYAGFDRVLLALNISFVIMLASGGWRKKLLEKGGVESNGNYAQL